MSASQPSIARKSLWTIGTYAASAVIRFGSNIVLSRLLGPEILGVLVIAQAIRTGSELLTDIGLEQNVIHSRDGDDHRFLNTLWTMQVARGLLVSLACAALSPFLAEFYRVDLGVLLAVSVAPLLNSFVSTSIFSASRRLDVKMRNLFELGAEAAGLVINVALAVTLQNVWAPILGILLSVAARSALSYLLPRPVHRFTLDPDHMRAIFHFSKWIMLSSIAFYAAVYIDRLFLGRVVTLATLGVYGLAKAVSDLPNTVAGRLAFQIIFPFVASHEHDLLPGSAARGQLSRVRRNFLLLVLAGIGTVMAWSDWAVHLLYGRQYAAAGWMLCLLLVGSWIGVLSALHEAAVYGRGKAQNVSVANIIRVIVMAAVLSAGFATWGLPGVFLALPASELVRYLILLRVQLRLKLTFVAQDLALTAGLLAVFGSWVAIRLAAGLGVPWMLIG